MVVSNGWNIETEPGFYDSTRWTLWIANGVAAVNSALGVGEAAEDLFINPDDIDLEPDLIQTDYEEWTILPEAD